MKLGQKVRLRTPDNPRLNNATGEVVALFEYGAHVATSAAGSGRFRALWSEMEPIHENGPKVAQEKGFTGDECLDCGGMNVKRNGTCLVCTDCGKTSGCS